MANQQVDTGHSTTITFGTSAQTFNVTGIQLPSESRTPIGTHHLGSTKMTKMAGDLADHDAMGVEFQFDAQAALPVTDTAAQTITVTLPLASGTTTAATYAGSALITKVETPNLQTEQLQTGKLEVVFDEVTGPTFTAAS